MRVALLENDRHHSEQLSEWLVLAGHRCSAHIQEQSLLRALRQEIFDALIVVGTPDMTGVGVLKHVRGDLQSSLPVLFVTNGSAESTIVTVLNHGADDCMVRPCRRLELLARLTAITRHRAVEAHTPAPLDFGPLRVDCEMRTARLDAQPVHLTAKDFDLAVLFLRNIGRLLSRGRIRQAVWGPRAVVSSRTLDTHVCRIRNRLRLTPPDGWQLSAAYGFGYCLRQIASPASKSNGVVWQQLHRTLEVQPLQALRKELHPVSSTDLHVPAQGIVTGGISDLA